MARKIKRISENGAAEEVVQQTAAEAQAIESLIVVLACRLGQTLEEAQLTRELYLNEMLGSEDRQALLDEYKVLVSQVQTQLTKKKATAATPEVSNGAAFQNPRDPSRIKQKVTIRDKKTGMVVRLDNV